MFIYPYKKGSQSAKALAQALPAKRIKLVGSRFRPSLNKTVINWGCSEIPEKISEGCFVVNKDIAVSLAAKKDLTFTVLLGSDVNVPDHVLTRAAVPNEDALWFARTTVTGRSGQGIIIFNPSTDPIPEAPLYTKFIPKTREYRVHVMNGEVIDTQRKRRSTAVPDDQVNWKIRNHSNGFIFARNDGEEVPQDVLGQGVAAVEALGLDFGAVDVIYSAREDKVYVLEVNTAPGLTGTTLTNYAEAFRRNYG